MSVYQDIRTERLRAHAKHGDKSMESGDWADMKRLRILIEEVGEVARVFNEWDLGHLSDSAAMVAAHDELIQVAAMAAAWADACPVTATRRGLTVWQAGGDGPWNDAIDGAP